MFLPLPLFACGIGGLFTLMMSMTADVCDLDELETSKRREGTFGAIYWWMVKFGGAFGGLATGAILSFIGYDGSAAAHSESTRSYASKLYYSPLHRHNFGHSYYA